MKTIRWGIIGCGDVTEVKSGPGFQKAPNAALQAVMRRDASLAEDYAKRHGVPQWYSDAEALIHDPQVDAVYIATPPAYHKEYTLLCAQAGKPVYVEKPMALNTAECEAMIQACREAGVPLFVAFYRRALPKFIQVRDWIAEGLIGDVRFVQMTHYQPPSADERTGQSQAWRVNPAIAGGGKFVDLASHTLDIMDFILGPVQTAKGAASNQAGLYAADDIVSAQFLFESGVHGTGIWCFNAAQYVEMNEIVGSKGRIRFSTFVNDGPVEVFTETESFEKIFPPPAHIQQPLITLLTAALNGNGESPSNGETAMRTSRVMDAIYKDLLITLT
ncbi:oxidoreductase [Paenibacillus swuensis]|uniref:Oxidoreductase n=1 Tax=Paenibacillus swuensis TaxID=1178515 RepID=A0A172TEY5_9BACL|nr:Gfo/Idh/MocA family oxidoreductase [Paenibacillus swuensis]ANE45601.1 oxidoreductase [Paenibacillus swuensis]